jgi:uncharacterized protein with NRDE domain
VLSHLDYFNATYRPTCLYLFFQFNSRSTRSAHWWDDQEGVVGGRDCVGGGTWLCAHVDGRVAFLTNFRKKIDAPTTLTSQPSISRGVLPTNFVTSSQTPRSYLSHINGAAYSHYGAGFNLVVADLGNSPEQESNITVQKYRKNDQEDEEEEEDGQQPHTGSSSSSQVYYMTNAPYLGDSNAPTEPIALPPGVHGLSNAVLDTPWPKVALGRRKFDDLAGCGAFDGESFPWQEVFAIMKDSTVLETDPNKLPDTGYGPEFESAASALFMDPPVRVQNTLFGTRSVAVLAVPRDSRIPAELREQYLTEEGGWAEERHRFHMKLAEQLPKLD